MADMGHNTERIKELSLGLCRIAIEMGSHGKCDTEYKALLNDYYDLIVGETKEIDKKYNIMINKIVTIDQHLKDILS